MASKATTTSDSAETHEFPLTLDEVCSRMSLTDRRVELIGAFHADEKANGRTKDTETAYKARFVAFCKQPA
jgi:hypothetical protein